MDTKKIAIGVFLTTTAVFAVLFLKKPSVIQTTTLAGEQKAPIVNVSVPPQPTPIVNVNVPKQTPSTQTFGAIPGYDFASPYFSVGGVATRAWTDVVDVSASTTCSFGPIVATSTLVRASANFTRLATSTRAEIGKATTAFATTTSWGAGDIPTGGSTLVATSTTFYQALLVPGDYVNVKIGNGSTAGTVTNTGKCQLVVQEL